MGAIAIGFAIWILFEMLSSEDKRNIQEKHELDIEDIRIEKEDIEYELNIYKHACGIVLNRIHRTTSDMDMEQIATELRLTEDEAVEAMLYELDQRRN